MYLIISKSPILLLKINKWHRLRFKDFTLITFEVDAVKPFELAQRSGQIQQERETETERKLWITMTTSEHITHANARDQNRD